MSCCMYLKKLKFVCMILNKQNQGEVCVARDLLYSIDFGSYVNVCKIK